MKREIKNAIGTVEDIGENVFTIAMVLPDVIENSIELGRDLVIIPLVAIKDTTLFAAEKVDNTVDIIV